MHISIPEKDLGGLSMGQKWRLVWTVMPDALRRARVAQDCRVELLDVYRFSIQVRQSPLGLPFHGTIVIPHEGIEADIILPHETEHLAEEAVRNHLAAVLPSLVSVARDLA